MVHTSKRGRMGRQIRLLPLKDCQLKKGCYQPAHKETIEWRTGWRTGFVRTWKEKTGNCAEEFFRSASRDGWEKGKEAGVWDASSECPAYPHPRGVKQCVTKFRATWRLGWYKNLTTVEATPRQPATAQLLADETHANLQAKGGSK